LEESRAIIEQLVDAQLVEVMGRDVTGNLRYQLHDLVHLLAQELARSIPPEVQREAIARLGGGYLTLAASAEDRFQPGEIRITGSAVRWDDQDKLADYPRDPLNWFSVERSSLVIMIEDAFEREMWPLAWELAHSLAAFFEVHAHWDDWDRTHSIALVAAREVGSAIGEAAIRFDLGALYRDRGRLNEAIASYNEALNKFEEAGDTHGKGLALIGLGIIHRNLQDWDTAEDLLRRAALILKAVGDRRVGAQALRSLGIVLGFKGKFGESERCFIDAGAEFRDLGDRRAAAYNDRGLGDLYRLTGQPEKAGEHFEQSLNACRELGDLRGQAQALQGSARVLIAGGETRAADTLIRKALQLVDGVGDRILEDSLQRDLSR
jgi:tetratricopeptide (TPR) repeat protein